MLAAAAGEFVREVQVDQVREPGVAILPGWSAELLSRGAQLGAAGVALAGLLASAEQYQGQNVVVVVCGGNISRDTLRKVI